MLLHKTPVFLILYFAAIPFLFGQNGEGPRMADTSTRTDTSSSGRRLQPDSTIWIGEVTVDAFPISGRLRTIPGSVSVLTGEGISLTDGTNLATSLNTLPGVTMQSGTFATGRIVIRGMGSRTPYNTNRIRAYLNEIPITGSDGISSPEELDMQSLGRIEVVKGPASALYGSGLGGSMNIYTPVVRQTAGEAALQYGAWQTANLRFSGSLQRDHSNWYGSVSHLQSDGYRENNGYRRTSLLSNARWGAKRWSVTGTILATDSWGGIPSSLSLSQFTESPTSAAANWKAIKGYQQNSKIVTGVTLAAALSTHITNQLTLYGKWDDNFERRPFNDLDDQSFSTGIRNKLTIHGPKTDWVAGGEWMADQYGWELSKEGALLNENRENRRHLTLFSMVWYRPAPGWTITAAGAINRTSYRLTDLYPENGDQSGKRNFPLIFSPRIGFNYSPDEKLALFASVGHGYSMPSPEETLLPEGDVNPDIRPEQGFQYEAGTRLSLLDGRMGIEGVLYWIELNNLLVTKRITEDIFSGTNAGKTRHQGFELLLRNRLWSMPGFPGQLSSLLSYTRSLNRFVDFTDDGNVYDGNHLPGIPGESIHYQLIWQPVNKFEVVTHLSHSGSQYLNDGNSLKADGYFLANVKLTSSLPVGNSGTMKIYAGINNLTDTHYASMIVVNAVGFGASQPRYFYPGLPMHGYAGIRFLF